MRKEAIEKVIQSRRRINHFIREGSVELWINTNLTIPQMKCLCYISRHGKINLSGLAAGIHVTPANVTGIIDRLVEQGLVRPHSPTVRIGVCYGSALRKRVNRCCRI